MVLLANVVPVVTPEHDNCIIQVLAVVVCIQNDTNTRVGERGGCELALNGVSPLSFLLDDLEFFSRHHPAPGWYVIQIVFLHWR